jgi:exoribonuclease II
VLNLRSRALVKEAMLMAGETAARYALQRNLAFPFTSQESPDPTVLEEILNRLGGSRLPASPDQALAFALRRAQKRSLVSSQPGPHAGLGLAVYTRTTSPLRRYSDLAAHQQLRAGLRAAPALDEASLLERVGEADAAASVVNQVEGLARRHWTLVYLQQHPGWQGEGILVEKRNGRGKVIVPELALETQIHLRKDLLLNSRLPLALRGMNLAELEAYF